MKELLDEIDARTRELRDLGDVFLDTKENRKLKILLQEILDRTYQIRNEIIERSPLCNNNLHN